MRIRLGELCDKIDRAIVFFSNGTWLDKWKIQKAIFYYLWLDSLHYKYNFLEAAKKLDINPNKQGMFSPLIIGSEETLVKDGYLSVKDVNDPKYEIKATEKGIQEILPEISKGEMVFLEEIKDILLKLSSKEFMFFVYYHPYIADNVKEFFLSESEMKESFNLNQEYYIKKLLNEGLIDENGAALIRKKIYKKI